MKFLITLILFIIFNTAKAEDYIIQFQAKVKNLKEFSISKSEKFRSYELEGTFTDNFGNYGKSSALIVSDIINGKILRLEGTNETIYSNNEKIYSKVFREKSDIDARIADMKIVGATNKLKPLIGTSCIISVRYFEDAIFGIQKCKLSQKKSKLLKK